MSITVQRISMLHNITLWAYCQ